MPIYSGSSKIGEIYLGSNKVSEVYRGSDLVWSAEAPGVWDQCVPDSSACWSFVSADVDYQTPDFTLDGVRFYATTVNKVTRSGYVQQTLNYSVPAGDVNKPWRIDVTCTTLTGSSNMALFIQWGTDRGNELSANSGLTYNNWTVGETRTLVLSNTIQLATILYSMRWRGSSTSTGDGGDYIGFKFGKLYQI